MERYIDKIQKTSERNQEESERKLWADLPQDILSLILRKLHSVDRIRLRAVCKSWRISEDRMMKYRDHPPWGCHLSSAVDGINGVEGDIFDPYSHQIFRFWNSLEKHDHLFKLYNYSFKVQGSKQGWLILGCYGYCGSSIFTYNPFSNDRSSYDVYIASYYMSYGDKEWSIDFLETTEDVCCGMQYVNGEVFFLLEDAVLKSYSLADKSWTLLTRGLKHERWTVYIHWLWLIEDKGDLLMIRKLRDLDEWLIFRFNWCNMNWDIEIDLDDTAIFISGGIAMKTPLVDVDNGKKLKDSRVFFFEDEAKLPLTCYSFTRRGKIESQEYGWIEDPYVDYMAFIEPPYITKKVVV